MKFTNKDKREFRQLAEEIHEKSRILVIMSKSEHEKKARKLWDAAIDMWILAKDSYYDEVPGG